jgi:hypothetical protein
MAIFLTNHIESQVTTVPPMLASSTLSILKATAQPAESVTESVSNTTTMRMPMPTTQVKP